MVYVKAFYVICFLSAAKCTLFREFHFEKVTKLRQLIILDTILMLQHVIHDVINGTSLIGFWIFPAKLDHDIWNGTKVVWSSHTLDCTNTLIQPDVDIRLAHILHSIMVDEYIVCP